MTVLNDFTSKKLTFTYISTKGYRNIPSDQYVIVSPLSGRATAIYWQDLPVSSDTIYIQKSDSALSGWITLAECNKTAYVYVDFKGNNTLNRHPVTYYRLVSTADSVTIGDAKTDGYIDAYGAEMSRRHRIQLVRGHAGVRVYVFHRMHQGVRCPDCWDDILQKRSRVNCATCNNTGYIVGYCDPIETYISFGPENLQVSQEIDGPKVEPGNVQCWLGNFPLLANGDLILEPIKNRFWCIKSIGVTMHQRVITKQDIVLAKEEGDDPLYQLIKRIPSPLKEATAIHGQSTYKHKSEISEGIYFSGT